MTAPAAPGKRRFFGWRLVGALGVILFFTGGGGLYVFPVFIQSFQAEFGWTMTEISTAAAFFAIVMGLSGPVVGVLFERVGARPTMMTAALLVALASLAYSRLSSLTMLYILTMISGLGIAGTTILPAQTLVTNWFDIYRGRALALAMLGIGFGGFLLPPFNEFLIRMIGWRSAWVVSAGFTVVVVIPLIATFVHTRPADLGLLPDGLRHGETHGSTRAAGLTVKRATGTAAFWLLGSVFVFQLIGMSALNFHFVPFAIQQGGFASQTAAFYLGLTVGFSVLGRIAFGWLVDRWSPRWLMACAGVLLALGPLAAEMLIVRLGLREAAVLVLYAIPFGLGIGGHAITLPVLVGRCFGELHFSKIMGLILSGFALGILIGIPTAGWIFDRTGSYEMVLILCTATGLLSALCASLIEPGRYRAEFEVSTIT
jgi:MFS family permease